MDAQAVPPHRPRLGILATLWTRDSSSLQECGVEALLFLHYLRSLFILFGLSTILITPSIASFNYFAATHPVSTDWLNRLSWSNLPTKDTKLYWLYAMLLPLMVALVLYVLTQNIARAVELRGQALFHRDDGLSRGRRFFVALTNIPRDWDLERVQHYYSEWRDRIDHIRHIPVHASRRPAKLAWLIRLIERRETAFIAEMVRRSGTMDERGFQHFLLTCLQKRYSSGTGRRWTWPGNDIAPMPVLYQRFTELVTSMSGGVGAPESSTNLGCVLMALKDYRWARILTDFPPSIDGPQCHARFLGSSAADIIVANLGRDGNWAELRRSLVQILTFILAISWTFPMAMVGGLSQISVFIQLVPSLSRWKWPSWLLGVVQGVVPSLVTSILMWLFPRLLQVIMDRAGYLTHTDMELYTQQVYFAFLFVQLFLNPSISSGLVPIAFAVLDNGVTEVPRILAQNLPLAGNYYLSYLLVQAILLVVSVLLRPLALVNLYRASRGTRTPREQVGILWNLFLPVRWGELYPFYSVLAVIGK